MAVHRVKQAFLVLHLRNGLAETKKSKCIRQGSPRIQGILGEAAWAAINNDQYWKQEYQRRGIGWQESVGNLRIFTRGGMEFYFTIDYSHNGI